MVPCIMWLLQSLLLAKLVLKLLSLCHTGGLLVVQGSVLLLTKQMMSLQSHCFGPLILGYTPALLQIARATLEMEVYSLMSLVSLADEEERIAVTLVFVALLYVYCFLHVCMFEKVLHSTTWEKSPVGDQQPTTA